MKLQVNVSHVAWLLKPKLGDSLEVQCHCRHLKIKVFPTLVGDSAECLESLSLQPEGWLADADHGCQLGVLTHFVRSLCWDTAL